jgi:hypothetical protein
MSGWRYWALAPVRETMLIVLQEKRWMETIAIM